MADPMGGSFRWAVAYSRERLRTFLVGTVVAGLVFVVIGAAFVLPESPTFAERATNGLVSFGLAVVFVVLVVFFYALLAAPYQQRNELRRQVQEDAAKRLVSDLVIEPSVSDSSFYFKVTNNGPTDFFQVAFHGLGAAASSGYLSWRSEGRTTVREKQLVTGAFGSVYGFGQSLGEHFELCFLSRTREPLFREFQARQTMLGKQEIKAADDEWPVRSADWLAQVEAALSEMRAALSNFESIDASDRAAGEQIIKDLLSQVRSSGGVFGSSFFDAYPAVHRSLHPNVIGVEASPRQYVSGYREAVATWIDKAQAVVDRGTDAPFPE